MRKRSPRVHLQLMLQVQEKPEETNLQSAPAGEPSAADLDAVAKESEIAAATNRKGVALVCSDCHTLVCAHCPQCGAKLEDHFTHLACPNPICVNGSFTNEEVADFTEEKTICDRCRCRQVGDAKFQAHLAALDGPGKTGTKKHAHKPEANDEL